MKLEILSNKEISNTEADAIVAWSDKHKPYVSPRMIAEYLLSGEAKEDTRKALLKAQQQATVKDIAVWGEEPCPHAHKVLPNRPKRACDLCWDELKKQAGI